MVDYSKWDKFDVSDSESDEGPMGGFQRLDEPSSVTIGASGPPMVHAPSATLELGGAEPDAPSLAPPAAPEAKRAPAATAPPRAASAVLTRNGGLRPHCAWSQDAREVVLHVQLPTGTKAKQVDVVLDGVSVAPAPGGGGAAAKGSGALGSLHVHCDGVVVVGGPLASPVAPPADAEPGEVEWELVEVRGARALLEGALKDGAGGADCATAIGEADCARLCKITLLKRSPIPGAVQWWSRVFEGDDTIDVTQIADRKQNSGGSMSAVWAAAQARFHERAQGTNDLLEGLS